MSSPIIRNHRLATCGIAVGVALAGVGCSSDDDESNADLDPVEHATLYWEALAAGDRETALSLVDPALVESRSAGNPFGRAHTLDGQFDWYEAVGWEWTLQACSTSGDELVECTATASNAWSDALGVEPVTGTFQVSFTDDGISSVDDSSTFDSQWVPEVFSRFQTWVGQNHPDDAAVMFQFGEDVNAEILALYETNTERFVEAQTS